MAYEFRAICDKCGRFSVSTETAYQHKALPQGWAAVFDGERHRDLCPSCRSALKEFINSPPKEVRHA